MLSFQYLRSVGRVRRRNSVRVVLKQLYDFGIVLFYLSKDMSSRSLARHPAVWIFIGLFQEGTLPAPLNNVIIIKEM